MTALDQFLTHWRAWRAALTYVLSGARRCRLRLELVLEVLPHDDADAEAIADSTRGVLAGWQARSQSNGWIRLTGPTR